VTVREGSAVAGKSLRALKLIENFDLTVKSIKRDGQELSDLPAELVLRPGDELIMSGPTQAFANNAALFRGSAESRSDASTPAPTAVSADENALSFASETGISLDTRVNYTSTVDSAVCSHLDRIRPVFPSAPGCEECLRIGAEWVHLRLCLTCGHVGCCDTSDYKHATAHFRDTEHPVMKSIEVLDDWAWCFVDEEYI
jgi:hypothetical protein